MCLTTRIARLLLPVVLVVSSRVGQGRWPEPGPTIEGITPCRLGSSDGAVAGRLASNLYLERSFGWDTALEQRVTALTPEALRRVVAQYLDPAALTYIKAGDFRAKGPAATTP